MGKQSGYTGIPGSRNTGEWDFKEIRRALTVSTYPERKHRS